MKQRKNIKRKLKIKKQAAAAARGRRRRSEEAKEWKKMAENLKEISDEIIFSL